MKKNKTPASNGAKQRSISSFFSVTPKAAGADATPAKGGAAVKQAPHDLQKENRSSSDDEHARAKAAAPSPAPPQPPAHAAPLAAAARAAEPGPEPATPAAAAAGGKEAAAGAGGAGAAGGRDLVGRRVSIFWPKEQAWFDGEIDDADEDGRHHVTYDDGDDEWVSLPGERHKLLPAKGSAAAKRAAAKRRHVVLSDDDEEEDDDGGDSGSEYKADSDDEDEAMEDLEEEGNASEDGDASGDDASDGGGGGKRKRGGKGKAPAPRKRGPAATPGSAGRTPMTATKQCARAGSEPSPSPAAAATPASGFGAATPFACGGRGGGASATPATPATGSRGGSRTPGSAGLVARLESTPGASHGAPAPEQAVVLGVSAQQGGEAARFAARMAQKFPFLQPNRIKDAKGRRPGDEGYDPRTLHVPTSWFKEAKVTEAQQQWWKFKAANFDSVLLFKVGKFYEMFNMDAYVGVDVLNLQFMKGEQAHAGFPEAAYSAMAEQLARAGYRVVVVEQTETPEMLAARNARRSTGEKKASVVERQAVAVLSRGTLTDAEMVGAHPDASYALAVIELEGGAGGHDRPVVGACALDAAAGQVLLGSWRDDEVRLALRTHLTALRPVELVMPRGGALSDTTRRLLKCALKGPQVNELAVSSGPAASAADALKALRAGGYFKALAPAADSGASPTAALPPLLESLRAGLGAPAGGDAEMADAAGGASEVEDDASEAAALSEAALRALGLMVQFLKDGLLDSSVLPHARYEPLCAGGASGEGAAAGCDAPAHMSLDGAALENLELLENSSGGTQGTLLALLDHCSTPFGRRRLCRWLVRPLFRATDIARRQDAVEELMTRLADAAGAARRALAGVSDLERALARLAASAGGEGGGVGREAPHVVLYEDVSKKRVRRLVTAIRDTGAVGRALAAIEKAAPESALLAGLVGGGRWGGMEGALQEMEEAADWKEAEASGRVVPSRGADAAYDAACDGVGAAEDELEEYLVAVRQKLGCREVKYVSQNKDTHILEVPDAASGRVPSSFSLFSQKKGFKRYTTDKLKALVRGLAEAQDAREGALGGILQSLERKFVARRELWSAAVEAAAVVDALMALAGAALAAEGVMTRPRVLDALPSATLDSSNVAAAASESSNGRQPRGPFFHATQLRHPAGLCGAAGAFVPNDVRLGGGAPRLLLLTGPNMGGKSTLLRQVCLAAVLAQVGAWVPAEELTMTAMDGVYVRMGARDNILAGQSTFFVELNETGAMLSRATEASLVALDELGRGTATLDGAAIASAVLDHLAHNTRCCGLFATHYHQLTSSPPPGGASAAGDATGDAGDATGDACLAAAPMHMACAVAESAGGGEGAGGGGEGAAQEVTFLYQLTPGACPKSYGTNVARLAGLPAPVVSRAADISAAHEARASAGAAAGTGGGGEAAAAAAREAFLAATRGPGGGEEGPGADALLKTALECIRRVRAGGSGVEEAQRAAKEVLAAA